MRFKYFRLGLSVQKVGWPHLWPSTDLDCVETVRTRASESIGFRHKSTEKSQKSLKNQVCNSSGRRGRRLESCHLDHKEKDALVESFSFCLCVMEKRACAAAGGQVGRTPCALWWRCEPPRRFFLQSTRCFVDGYLSPRPFWLWEAFLIAFFFVYCDANFEGWPLGQPSLRYAVFIFFFSAAISAFFSAIILASASSHSSLALAQGGFLSTIFRCKNTVPLL